MSLLSDPEPNSSKWAHNLINYHRLFCFMLCLSAYIWFCLLAHNSLNNVNSFSENALLPGLVRSEFIDDGTAKRFLQEFETELSENYATSDSMPVPWLVAKMSQLNLDVYTHNFSLNFPLGKKQVFHGENVYGILRAGRTASTEALVISVPYRPLSSHFKSTNGGIALMLAMAKFARSKKYWAKDLIFLVTAHELLGAQAWLQAYYDIEGPSTQWLDAGVMKGRAGAIQAAINLEMSSLKFNHMEVKIEGLNGQLPNLDLVTLVHKMCTQAGLNHAYKNSNSWTHLYSEWKRYISSLETLLSMMTTQVLGNPSGNHGLFHRYGIEAVTLMSVGESGGLGRPAQALEAILRSLNNLLERFHQSYFFYLRTRIDRFLSISQYMPPLGLLCAALFIRAFGIWLISQKQAFDKLNKNNANKTKCNIDGDGDNEDAGKEKIETGSKSREQCVGSGDNANELVKRETTLPSTNNFNVLNVLFVYAAIHFIGFQVMESPQILSQIGLEHFSLQTEEAIFYGLCIISLILIFLLPLVINKLLHNSNDTRETKDSRNKMLMILALLELGSAILCVGVYNFSLGFGLAAAYTPFVLAIGSEKLRQFRLSRCLLKSLWLLLNPMVVTLLVVFEFTVLTFPDEIISVIVSRGLSAAQQAVVLAIVDGMVYGNWIFNVVTSVFLPLWIVFWQILNS